MMIAESECEVAPRPRIEVIFSILTWNLFQTPLMRGDDVVTSRMGGWGFEKRYHVGIWKSDPLYVR